MTSWPTFVLMPANRAPLVDLKHLPLAVDGLQLLSDMGSKVRLFDDLGNAHCAWLSPLLDSGYGNSAITSRPETILKNG